MKVANKCLHYGASDSVISLLFIITETSLVNKQWLYFNLIDPFELSVDYN